VAETLPLRRRTGLTPFTYTRFLVPWLCGFRGRALFLDADILCRKDPIPLWKACVDDETAVWTCLSKPKFEWAAVMMFNCAHPDNGCLTPDFVETIQAPHKLSWTQNVGDIPSRYHNLVLYEEPDPDAVFVHFTAIQMELSTVQLQ